MISQLSGTVAALGPNWLVVDVGGVGFHLSCTPGTVADMRLAEPCFVFTKLIVREDSLTLFGFADIHERQVFELLQLASGVGPKLALGTLSVLSPAEVIAAISQDEVATLIRVPGIGRKGAEKIIVELRDRVAQVAAELESSNQADIRTDTSLWRQQVSSGLQGLGWSLKDAEMAVEHVAPLVEEDPQIMLGKLMKAALQSLARN